MHRSHSLPFFALLLLLCACSQTSYVPATFGDGQGSANSRGTRSDGTAAIARPAVAVSTALPIATATPVVSVTPVPGSPKFYAAGDIADSVGVNANVFPYPTMQPSDATQLGTLVGAAHIRHFRLFVVANNAAYVQNVLGFQGASHAAPMLLTDCNPKVGQYGLTSGTMLKTFYASLNYSADAVEGVNEPDTRYSQDPNFSSDLDTCQKSVSQILTLPYVAPAVAQAGRYQYVGTIPGMGVANIHRYLAGHNPGTVGYGPSHNCGFEYASLGYLKCYAAGEAGTGKPFYVTETGWNTDNGEVDLTTQAKYSTRVILYDFINGVSRTYFNPLVTYTGADGFGGNALLNADRSPKPVYTAIKTLLNALADDGRAAGFTAPGGNLGVLGGSSSIVTVPMQKSDGTTVVAIWNETLSYDSPNKRPIGVPAQTIKMSIPTGQVVKSIGEISDGGTLTTTSYSLSGLNIVFPVDDHVTLVTFGSPVPGLPKIP